MRSLQVVFYTLAVVFLSSRQVAAQQETAKNFEFKQCNEDVLVMRVDPEPLQELVRSDFTLLLDDGKARVAIIVQDCSQYWIDGENLGPNQHNHVWVRVEGPEDVRSVVGAQETWPTLTWFNVFTGSTNPRDREARKASGSLPEPIEGLSLDPPEWPRGGRVTLGPAMSYTWRVPSAERMRRLIGVNHDIYERTDDGRLRLKRVQALVNATAVPSEGTLKVLGGVDPRKLIGAGTYPVRVYTFSPIWARATLGDDLPE
jgi:hypothetical protein